MSLTKRYWINCDYCYKPAPAPSNGHTTGEKARSSARRDGWKRVPKRNGESGGDYCPRCAAAGVR